MSILVNRNTKALAAGLVRCLGPTMREHGQSLVQFGHESGIEAGCVVV
jgi:hypothetical protein